MDPEEEEDEEKKAIPRVELLRIPSASSDNSFSLARIILLL